MSTAWSDDEINALRFPRPEGEIAKVWNFVDDSLTGGSPERSPEHLALRWIAEHGDLIEAPLPSADVVGDVVAWLLTPVPSWVLHVLATIGAAFDELETDGDREPEETDDDEVDGEDGGDSEPWLGATAAVDQDVGWQNPLAARGDAEKDHDDREPDHDGELITWEHWTPDPPRIGGKS